MVTKRIKGDATLNFFTSIQFVVVRKREGKKILKITKETFRSLLVRIVVGSLFSPLWQFFATFFSLSHH